MIHWRQLKRDNRFFVASTVVVLFGFVLFIFLSSTVFAFTLLGDREIRMDSSQPGDVNNYTVEFNVSTTGDLGGIVVTFCANSPTIGDSECETPPNFDLTTALANLNAGDIDLTGYQAVTADHSSSGTGGDNTVVLHSGTEEYSLGDTGPAGGLVFHIDGDIHYEAAPSGWNGGSDPAMQWGCRGQSVPGASGTVIGTGVSNTQAIVNFHDDPSNFDGNDYYTFGGDYTTIGCAPANNGEVAAKTVSELNLNGHSDWFLPSQDELNAMYQNLHLESLGGFASDFYWSSSEFSSATAVSPNFSNGDQPNSWKNSATARFRPARAFTVTQSASMGDTASFDLVNVTNQNTEGTFYARIYTYADPEHALGYTLEDPWAEGDVVDAGGVALSTAETIDIRFMVPERLTFCVFTNELSAPGDFETCTGTSTDPVSLGNNLGFLSPEEPSISKDTKYNIATNAAFGATIRVRGNTLSSGSLSIDPIGDATPGDGVAAASAVGTEQFGMCTYQHASSIEDGITPQAPYNSANCAGTTDGQGAGNDNNALFGFDQANLTSQYGHAIAQKAPGEWSTGILVLLANITDFTEPGVYSTTFNVISTGRY